MSSEPPPRFSSSGIASRPRRSGISVTSQFREPSTPVVPPSPASRPRRSSSAARRSDVGVHRFGQRLVHVQRPRRPEHARCHGGVRHQRRPCAIWLPISHMRLISIRRFAEVVPDRGVAWNDVRLITAVGDHVVRPLLNPEVFTSVVPTDVHQFHRIEGASSSPRSVTAVGRLALECVFNRNQTVSARVSPAGARLVPTWV